MLQPAKNEYSKFLISKTYGEGFSKLSLDAICTDARRWGFE
jgi:hypothetical protein